MSSERIDAPRRVIDSMKQAEESIKEWQAAAQNFQAGARAALNVPDGWQWDGSGWKAQDNEKPAE